MLAIALSKELIEDPATAGSSRPRHRYLNVLELLWTSEGLLSQGFSTSDAKTIRAWRPDCSLPMPRHETRPAADACHLLLAGPTACRAWPCADCLLGRPGPENRGGHQCLDWLSWMMPADVRGRVRWRSPSSGHNGPLMGWHFAERPCPQGRTAKKRADCASLACGLAQAGDRDDPHRAASAARRWTPVSTALWAEAWQTWHLRPQG